MYNYLKKEYFNRMRSFLPFWFNFLSFTLLLLAYAQSKIIFEQNLVPLILSDQQQSLQAFQDSLMNQRANLYQSNVKKVADTVVSSKINNTLLLQNRKQSAQVFVIQHFQDSQILNSNLVQRSQLFSLKNFPDQQNDSYTNPLSLISTLGIPSEGKIMEYVKIKIQDNRKRILEHNRLKKQPFQLAQNRFIIYSSDEFKQMFLTLKQPDDKKYQRNQPSQIVVEVPKSNLRKLEEININWKTAKKMTSVKYQKQCGACYSFTSIGAIQSAFLIKGQNLNLAQQEIVDCSTPYNNYGCVGGWTINAYKYIKDFGVLFESDYPYVASFNNCTIPQGASKYKIKNYVQLSNDCSVVTQALKNQPLSIAVNADGWQYYSSGIYTDCKAGASNHGVVLAGVDSTSWLIKNSWGFNWGEQGYIRISRTAPNNVCNVCRWASYPIV